jgi:hypothetical protein
MQAQITNPFARGTEVEYTKQIMFKGEDGLDYFESVIATIVAVNDTHILLDNGDELNKVQVELGKGY